MAELERVTAVIGADVSSYRNGMRQVTAGTREMANEVRRSSDQVRRTLINTGTAFNDVGTRFTQASGRMTGGLASIGQFANRNRQSIQQFGFQIGDVATQIGMGTSAISAFSVQGSQMLQVFGPFGAIAGAAVAVLGALTIGMMGAGEEAETFEDRIKDLADSIEDLDRFRDEILGLEELQKKYGRATQAVIDLINVRRQLKLEEAKEQISELTRELRDFLDLSTTGNLAAKLGIGDGFMGRGINPGVLGVQGSINDFFGSNTISGRADAAADLRDNLVEAAGGFENMNSASRELYEKLVDMEEVLREAQAATGVIPDHMADAADGANAMEGGVAAARDRAAELTANLQAAASAMASVQSAFQSAQDRLARSQIALQHRGDPQGEAMALLRRGTGQDIAEAQARMAGDIPKLIRDQMIEPYKEMAREAVQVVGEAVQNEQDKIQLDTSERAAASAAKKAARGGGREPRDVFGDSLRDFEEEIALLEHRRELIGRTDRQQAALTATFERHKAIQDVLNDARRAEVELTPQQIEEIKAQAAAVEQLTLANFDLTQEMKLQAEAADEAERKQKALAAGIADMADRMTNAITQADNFREALKNIGLEILNLSFQGLLGQGPLGGILGNVFGFLQSSAPISSPIPMARPFAAGGAFSNGRVVGTPTTFPMARGVGLMGEAGPEGVLPLANVGGKLGVRSTGGGGTTVIAPQYNISGLGLSAPEVEMLIRRNNRQIPELVRDAGRRGR